ncbi:MAG: Spo0B domain-containing protein [Clostridia bacterium]|nr:Spo0B domain-containing protein [Clostridia bacterium]
MEEFLKILSVRRHDFLNHIQVISGYLQLNKIDRAKEYLVQMADELTMESQLCNCRSGQVAVALLYLQHQAVLAGVKLSVRVAASLDASRVPEHILAAIIRVYGLTLQEAQTAANKGREENCLLGIFEEAEYIEWQFGIPSGKSLSRKFRERVGLLLGQEDLQLCVIQAFDGGVRLEIPKKLDNCENGNKIHT